MPHFNRRDFLRLVGATGTTVYFSPLAQGLTTPSADISEFSPIDRSIGDLAARGFSADDPERAHKVLWNKAQALADATSKTDSRIEETDLVIVGGGMSGLISAHLLRRYRPIVLEQAHRFGGNSKGQSWRGLDYALGAAYICEPEDGSDIETLLRELGLKRDARIKEGEDPVAIGKSIYSGFWTGDTVRDDPRGLRQINTLRDYFETVFNGESLPFPEIPFETKNGQSYIEKLDERNFRDHLVALLGEPIHPHIETALEHYCWSSFGASLSDVSAAAGLNFYAAEFGNLWVYPGGNSAIAERLVSRLTSSIGRDHLRNDSLVCDISVDGDGTTVKYFDADNVLRTIRCKVAICACPKFVAAKIIQNLEPERLAAIQRLRYHSYLVANVLIGGAPEKLFYDLYLLGSGALSTSEIRGESNKQGVTDVILANFAHSKSGDTVLTLYRGLPYDGARPELFIPTSYDTYRKQFESQIHDEILPLLNIAPERVIDTRLARWGHPLPVAATGLYRDRIPQVLRAPFKDRLFFIEQDNWALPAFETAATEALQMTPQISAMLGRKG